MLTNTILRSNILEASSRPVDVFKKHYKPNWCCKHAIIEKERSQRWCHVGCTGNACQSGPLSGCRPCYGRKFDKEAGQHHHGTTLYLRQCTLHIMLDCLWAATRKGMYVRHMSLFEYSIVVSRYIPSKALVRGPCSFFTSMEQNDQHSKQACLIGHAVQLATHSSWNVDNALLTCCTKESQQYNRFPLLQVTKVTFVEGFGHGMKFRG